MSSPSSIAELAARLRSREWTTRWDGGFPTRRPVAQAAADELVALGEAAVPALIEALACADHFELPKPSTDQGMYIGDYDSERIYVAAVAAKALGTLAAAKVAAPAAIPALAAAWRAAAPEIRREARDAI